MSSTRIVDRGTRLRVRPAMSKEIIPGAGVGGDQGPTGPIQKKPPASGPGNLPVPNPLSPIQQALDGLASGFNTVTADLLGGGEVLIGMALIVAGLLIATGQGGKVAKVGLFAATRGTVK